MHSFKKNIVFIFQSIIILSLTFSCGTKQNREEVSGKIHNHNHISKTGKISKTDKEDIKEKNIVLYGSDYMLKEEYFEFSLILPPNWGNAPKLELNNRKARYKTPAIQLVGFFMRKSAGNIPNISILTNYISNPEINSAMDYVKYTQKNPYIKAEEKPKEILLANKKGMESIYKIRGFKYISYYFFDNKTIIIISAVIDPDKFITEKEEIKKIFGTFTFKRNKTYNNIP